MATTTPNRGYQLPAAGSKLKDDVLRLIAALGSIDADVAAVLLAMADKSNVGHVHGMDAITGLVAALGNKLEVGYHDALANLTDVDVAGLANGMVLLRQASKWIPVALQVNNVAGLEAALAGKASSADVSAAIAAFVGAAPAQLDTLVELASALGNDANFAANVLTALGVRVRADSVQSFSSGQKTQARNNIEAASRGYNLYTGIQEVQQNADGWHFLARSWTNNNQSGLWSDAGGNMELVARNFNDSKRAVIRSNSGSEIVDSLTITGTGANWGGLEVRTSHATARAHIDLTSGGWLGDFGIRLEHDPTNGDLIISRDWGGAAAALVITQEGNIWSKGRGWLWGELDTKMVKDPNATGAVGAFRSETTGIGYGNTTTFGGAAGTWRQVSQSMSGVYLYQRAW